MANNLSTLNTNQLMFTSNIIETTSKLGVQTALENAETTSNLIENTFLKNSETLFENLTKSSIETTSNPISNKHIEKLPQISTKELERILTIHGFGKFEVRISNFRKILEKNRKHLKKEQKLGDNENQKYLEREKGN